MLQQHILTINKYMKKVKTTTPKTYQPDLNTPISITVEGLTVGLINDFIYLLQVGNNIDNSTELTAARATEIKNNSAKVQQIIINHVGGQFQKWVEEDQAKFEAEAGATV
jgi:hypothetical protein